MEIRTTSLLFPRKTGDVATATTEIEFSREVSWVAAGIVGYRSQFEDDEDHYVGRVEVEVDAEITDEDPNKVRVSGRFGLRDWSNEYDDPFSGVTDVAVFAELSPATAPNPGDARDDLIIVGAEVTQVIQHYRSADHLDPPNVFPDNSIRLIAGKPTVVRLYVDYDASSGLSPLISELSGILTLTGSAGQTTLTPIEPIYPRRVSSIQRGVRTHTLNFLLNDIQSVGDIEMTATVFSSVDSSQFSAAFQRTLRFESQPMLPILAVGIEYTGPDVNDPAELAAPTELDFLSTLEFTDRLYPVPGIMITDYRTMEYDGELESNIANGCENLGGLKDAVSDFAGDSDDVVYGLLGSGVSTGSVGGCGGGGVGVGKNGDGATAAHEIGHALGRQHAPCDNVTRCASPRNTDNDFPVYSGYDSDSIGEYGFDPTSMFGSVRSPADRHDFMGYSPLDWISPYTYKAIMSAVPGTTLLTSSMIGKGGFLPASASPAHGDADRAEWVGVKQPHLFLRLDIDGDKVVLHPSFQFAARPRRTTGKRTSYRFELRDEDGRVLGRTSLTREDDPGGCGCGGDTAGSRPFRIRQAVAFNWRAKVAVLLDGEKQLAAWQVPPPPEVTVECRCDDDDPSSMWLSWDARRQQNDDHGDTKTAPAVNTVAGETDRPSPWWALIQWRDSQGNWRGVAPRTQERRVRVPRRIARMGAEVHYRVLVTDELSTGVASCDEDCEGPPPPTDEPNVVIVGAMQATRLQELPRIIRATTVGGDRSAQVRWYDGGGGELSRGPRLDLGQLAIGRTVIAAHTMTDRVPTRTAQWQIERTSDDRFLLHGSGVFSPVRRNKEARSHVHKEGRGLVGDEEGQVRDEDGQIHHEQGHVHDVPTEEL